MSDELSQKSEDAIVTLLLQKLVTDNRYPNAYENVMSDMTPAQRAEIEACADRHAARMRAAGKRGW